MKDPLYDIECSVSIEQPDETFYYHLKEKPYLSYSLHKTLLGNSEVYVMLKNYNDKFHSNKDNKALLIFCPTKTLFTNWNKPYIFLDELRKEL